VWTVKFKIVDKPVGDEDYLSVRNIERIMEDILDDPRFDSNLEVIELEIKLGT